LLQPEDTSADEDALSCLEEQTSALQRRVAAAAQRRRFEKQVGLAAFLSRFVDASECFFSLILYLG